MSSQLDLFGAPRREDCRPAPADAFPPLDPVMREQRLEGKRQRLREMIALVQGAEVMPYPSHLALCRAENCFEWTMRDLPEEEAKALWALWDKEVERLFEQERTTSTPVWKWADEPASGSQEIDSPGAIGSPGAVNSAG